MSTYQDAWANLKTAFSIARELGPKAEGGLFPRTDATTSTLRAMRTLHDAVGSVK